MDRNSCIRMPHRVLVSNKAHELSREGDPSFANDPYPLARVPRQHRIRMLVRSIQSDRTPSIRGPSRVADPQLDGHIRIPELLARISGSESRQMRRKWDFNWALNKRFRFVPRICPDRQLHTRCNPRDFSNGWNVRRRFSSTTNTHGWVVATLTKPVFVRLFTRPAFNRGRG